MNRLFSWLFQQDGDSTPRQFKTVELLVLYVVGLVGWAYLLGWGRASLDYHDWTGINLPRLLYLQNAMLAGVWPLHMSGGHAMHGLTDRFLALPDVVTSPQTLLLLFMPVQQFVLVDVLLQYSIGFAGLARLRRYFGWSPYAFAFVFLLFSFNGHILAHYSAGHFTWAAYFVFPWIALCLFTFLDGDRSWTLIAALAFAALYMVLAGGIHQLTWMLILLVLLAPCCGRHWWWPLAAATASVLVCAVRLLPPALELASFRRVGFISDAIGFPSTAHLLTALVTLRREFPSFHEALPGNIWFFDSAFYEFTAFIGVAGLAIVLAGAWLWLRQSTPRYAELMVPMLAMLVLTMGSTFRIVRLMPIPLLEGERYTGRMLIVPLMLLVLITAGALDRYWRRSGLSVWHRALAVTGLALVAVDMAGAVRLWRVLVSIGTFNRAPFDPAIASVIERPDPVYVSVVMCGAAITLVTGIGLVVMARKPAKIER